MFLETAQIKIHQLIPFSFFFKANTAFSVVRSCKDNLIVYNNIKYTYLFFRSLVGMDFRTTLYAHCWTGAEVRWTMDNAPSILQISVRQDKRY